VSIGSAAWFFSDLAPSGDAEAFHLFRPQQAFGRVSLAGRFRGPFTGMLHAKVRANNTIAENALSP
jgi:hypothetical protein